MTVGDLPEQEQSSSRDHDPTSGFALDDPSHPSRIPPPHWTPKDQYDRHPKRVEDWDWQSDWTLRGRLDLTIRRLNFAADFADPRAPDQMALVLRKDLIALKHDWLRKNAVFEIWQSERAEKSSAKPGERESSRDELLELVRSLEGENARLTEELAAARKHLNSEYHARKSAEASLAKAVEGLREIRDASFGVSGMDRAAVNEWFNERARETLAAIRQEPKV